MAKVFYITGIDTGIGKTYAAGLLASYLHQQGKSVITAKMVQTGCSGVAEDILQHRRLMGIELLPEDLAGTTCPYVFGLPASPHLAAEAEGKTIAPKVIIGSVDSLALNYEYVIVEGAGGLLVPLTNDLLAVDIAAAQNWPVIIVSSARLGSINHTLMTIECAANRKCNIAGILYNLNETADSLIARDSRKIFQDRLVFSRYEPVVIDVPQIDKDITPKLDFSELFE